MYTAHADRCCTTHSAEAVFRTPVAARVASASILLGYLPCIDQEPFEVGDHEAMVLELREPGHGNRADAAAG
jgi:hypothetical protein